MDVEIAGVDGFDGGDFAVTEQAQELAEPPAGKGHVMGGEKKLKALLGRVGLCSFSGICSSV